ncbi:MAG: type II secretion system F family protein [Candidatus Micrarchaeia archaeon]|jgi:archaellum biogenesis protein FlaJ (TadC family)
MKGFEAFTAHVQTLLYDAELDVEPRKFIDNVLMGCFALGVAAGAAAYFLASPMVAYAVALAILLGVPVAISAYLTMRANKRTAQIEEMLPSFLSMMASNIRSGATYDRALLLSSRKEFGPLAREIDRAAKQTIAGKPLQDALMEMSKRTRSETFAKTIRLIVEGINAGGNLAEMLEITAIDIRKSSSLKKEVSATVLVYKLFIVIAATVGAPLLYALTGFLIDVFTGIRGAGEMSPGAAQSAQLPMFSGGDVISQDLFFAYAIIAIAMTTLLSTLASGVITRGKESEGLPDLGWSFLLAFSVFFGVRLVLGFMLGAVA